MAGLEQRSSRCRSAAGGPRGHQGYLVSLGYTRRLTRGSQLHSLPGIILDVQVDRAVGICFHVLPRALAALLDSSENQTQLQPAIVDRQRCSGAPINAFDQNRKLCRGQKASP